MTEPQKIKITGTGLIYRNPKPYLRAVHAMHPCLSVDADGHIIATFDLGQGPESLDYHTVLARSGDGGATWNLEGPLMAAAKGRRSTHSIRTSLLRNGTMIGVGALYMRDDPEVGTLNRENFGIVPMELFLVWSNDLGRHWSPPHPLAPPLQSPGWEVSHSPLELKSGKLAIPVSTWRGWDGRLPCGEQAVVFFSEDGGKTWPIFSRTFDGRSTGLIHWEQCLIERDSELIAVAWQYDPATGKSKPTVYARATGFPPKFGPATPAGFLAETCEILELDSNRILSVYRRADRPGLWATVIGVPGNDWVEESSAPLWQGPLSGMFGEKASSDELSDIKFGSPSMKKLPDGAIMVAFWCHEDEISSIRWIKLTVD